MCCPCNPISFLWFEYEGPHDWRIYRRSSSGVDRYRYDFVCAKCGDKRYRAHVTRSEMIRVGAMTVDGGDGHRLFHNADTFTLADRKNEDRSEPASHPKGEGAEE
jgi:hypothetical protein